MEKTRIKVEKTTELICGICGEYIDRCDKCYGFFDKRSIVYCDETGLTTPLSLHYHKSCKF